MAGQSRDRDVTEVARDRMRAELIAVIDASDSPVHFDVLREIAKRIFGELNIPMQARGSHTSAVSAQVASRPGHLRIGDNFIRVPDFMSRTKWSLMGLTFWLAYQFGPLSESELIELLNISPCKKVENWHAQRPIEGLRRLGWFDSGAVVRISSLSERLIDIALKADHSLASLRNLLDVYVRSGFSIEDRTFAESLFAIAGPIWGVSVADVLEKIVLAAQINPAMWTSFALTGGAETMPDRTKVLFTGVNSIVLMRLVGGKIQIEKYDLEKGDIIRIVRAAE